MMPSDEDDTEDPSPNAPRAKPAPGRSVSGDKARTERERRSAEALRRNLARRKAQLRGRKDVDGDSST